MQSESNNDIKNVIRMREIANIYSITKQNEKSIKYHRNIINLCDRYPQNEEMLMFKIESLNYLKKRYKSLETSNELLKLNPQNITALINIANNLKE